MSLPHDSHKTPSTLSRASEGSNNPSNDIPKKQFEVERQSNTNNDEKQSIHASISNYVDQRFPRPSNRHSFVNSLATHESSSTNKKLHNFISKWALFIGTIWVQFGIGYNWISQTALPDQFDIYFEGIQGFRYRFMNEIFFV